MIGVMLTIKLLQVCVNGGTRLNFISFNIHRDFRGF